MVTFWFLSWMRLMMIIIWSPMTEALSHRYLIVEMKQRPSRLMRRVMISWNRNAFHASGVLEMELGSGAYGTTLSTCRRGRLSKLTFLLVWLTWRWDYLVQYLLQGPVQRFVSLLGCFAWVFQVQRINFPASFWSDIIQFFFVFLDLGWFFN